MAPSSAAPSSIQTLGYATSVGLTVVDAAPRPIVEDIPPHDVPAGHGLEIRRALLAPDTHGVDVIRLHHIEGGVLARVGLVGPMLARGADDEDGRVADGGEGVA